MLLKSKYVYILYKERRRREPSPPPFDQYPNFQGGIVSDSNENDLTDINKCKFLTILILMVF
jgi:hypothetical protein